MHIRPLVRDDLPEVGDLAVQTFQKDELYTYLYPRQEQYPDDLRRQQLLRLRNRLVEVGSHGFAMVTDHSDADWSGKTEVTGIAFCVRTGEDDVAKTWRRDSLFNKLERYLISWEKYYDAKFFSGAADWQRITAYQQSAQYDFHSLLDPRWHLGLLAVSPRFQRRGIGTKLLRHVQEIASREEVPVTLESSVMARELYFRSGFKIVDESEIIAGLDGVAMVWEPVQLRGKWLEDEREGRARVKGRLLRS